MKKTLLSTTVALALAASFSASAAPDDKFIANVGSIDGVGAYSLGAQSPTTNAPVNSYSPELTEAQNVSLTNAYNDVNSDNTVTIGEDGNVAFAQDLDQAIAVSDLSHQVGNPIAAHGLIGGNQITENGVVNAGAQNPAPNTGTGNNWAKTNTIGGTFNNYGGLASASQNAGSTNAIGQSIVVQSNGGI